jgi:hypothetical protein
MGMSATKRAPGGRSSSIPAAPNQSEARVKTAKKWSPTQPSATRVDPEPDPLVEAHAILAELRLSLDALVLALDRVARKRK